MCTIGLIDTDREFLNEAAAALRSSGHETVSFSDAAGAIDALGDDQPDLVVCNFRMPTMDGIGFIRRFRNRSSAPVMFLSAEQDAIDEISGFKVGAADFQHKPIRPDVLSARVQAILRRTATAIPEADAPALAPDLPPMEPTYRYGQLAICDETRGCRYHGQRVRLTNLEYEVLSDLMRRPGKVRSRPELLDVIKRDDDTIEGRAIDTHIKRLRKKFRAIQPSFDPIESLYGIGYRLRPLAA
ncbi:two-component system response regulator ChvI [Bradyrhizobium sp. USDA 4341]